MFNSMSRRGSYQVRWNINPSDQGAISGSPETP